LITYFLNINAFTKMTETLKVCIQEGGMCPKRATDGSAGYDLYAAESAIIEPNSDLLAKLRINIALPKGHYAQIWPRSGMDLKHRVTTGAGVIDEDYRGEICVLLRNFGSKAYNIQKGDRVAQMIIMKYEVPTITVGNLNETNRGVGGFGSTGTQ
jgi:dUTP pyrophosphatase